MSKEVLTDDALKERVYQGLQKRKRCSLCEQEFFVDELPGAITFKSILELRQKWGDDVRKSNKLPSPSRLYKREELCIFCMQFFDVDNNNDIAASDHGKSGRSAQHSPHNATIGSNNSKSPGKKGH